MIEVMGDGVSLATIPERHRAGLDESLAAKAMAWNQRIADSGRRTQNYDKGLDRFVRKFDLDQELEATIAIADAIHQGYGPAVYITR
jgi:hypothetical protein